MAFSKPKRGSSRLRRKSGGTKLWKVLLLSLLLPAMVAAAFLIRYYYVFNALIEAKMQDQDRMAETRIYAAQQVLFPGKPLGCSELVNRIRRLGYQENRADANLSYYRRENATRVLIHNDASVPDAPNRLVEITCSEKAIRSIVDQATGVQLQRFPLKPELLSNAIDKSREKRRYVSYREIPQLLINAVLAAEDRRFFTHSGIDPIRIIKALIVNIREGETSQGASTLTQQFVKNYFLTPERTLKRKLTDAYMSILLEKRLTKNQIFELYCNEVYLGQVGSFSIIGFGKAADIFFNKSIQDLTLEEAATLAGIIAAPNRTSPFRYSERARMRRNLVLDRMADYGMISPQERDAAKSRPMKVASPSILNYLDAPYFVDYVQDLLIQQYGDTALAKSKFKVYTTLDTDLQQAAYEAVQKGLAELDAYFSRRKEPLAPGTVQASLIAVDPKNGNILAMIGGRNYGASQFNRITQSRRQPGSIFKPLVYAAALETAYTSPTPLTATSLLLDQPTQFTFDNLEYAPRNFNEEYLGQVTMRQAITKSLNIATIKLAEKVGYEKVAEMARRLGLNEQIKPYPAIAIGAFDITPLEMARAYTAFANGGVLSELNAITRIDDASGKPIFTAQPASRRVLTPQIAFLVTSLLQSVINEGTGAGARSRGFTLTAAGKTGTSHDGWFAGYTPELLCIVWVGFDDNRELNRSGSQSALPIWTEFMKKAATIVPLRNINFEQPEDIVQVEVDPSTGLLATEHCLQRENEYFIKGTEPKLRCYGNYYQHGIDHSSSTSIYTSPSKEAASGADNKREGRD